MDETTKVIIATLSGFIIAFFAEPVKNYFQNKSRLKNLKWGLYKELCDNYSWFRTITIQSNLPEYQKLPKETFMANAATIDQALRTEFYYQTLKNELSLFYQLPETSYIHLLHRNIIMVQEAIKKTGESVTNDSEKMVRWIEGYCDTFALGLYNSNLDKEIVRKIVPSGSLKEMIRRGKALAEKDQKEEEQKIQLAA